MGGEAFGDAGVSGYLAGPPSFGGIVSVYQKHEFAAEKAEALQRWAAHIEGLVSDKPSNVSKLRKRP